MAEVHHRSGLEFWRRLEGVVGRTCAQLGSIRIKRWLCPWGLEVVLVIFLIFFGLGNFGIDNNGDTCKRVAWSFLRKKGILEIILRTVTERGFEADLKKMYVSFGGRVKLVGWWWCNCAAMERVCAFLCEDAWGFVFLVLFLY